MTGKWRAACPLQIYGCRHIVSISAEKPIRGGCGLRALGRANLSFSGHFLEWARDKMYQCGYHSLCDTKSVE